MPHINKLFDFVISVFIVHRDHVLLVNHRRYDEWLPIGGHIELDEDPEEALYREIQEECGLKVRILTQKPKISHPGVKAIRTPSYVDVHRISDTHKHIAYIYFGVSSSRNAKLHLVEHRECKWLSEKDLYKREYKLSKSIRFYCLEALKAARSVRRSVPK